MSETTREIADQLVALLQDSKNVEAIQSLYDDAIETIEADSTRTRSGKIVVQQSMQDFADTHSFQYTVIEGPLISGDTFALRLRFEATAHESNQAFAVDEIGVYTVRDSKIVREQFYYPTS